MEKEEHYIQQQAFDRSFNIKATATTTATDYQNYFQNNYTNNQQYNNEQQQQQPQLQQENIAVIKTSNIQQQQHVANTAATATTTTNENLQQQQPFQCPNQQQQPQEKQPNPYKQLHQLTLRFLPIITSFGSSSIRFYNMNPSAYMMTAATANDDDDATTLELRMKPHNTKQRQQQQQQKQKRHKQPQQQQHHHHVHHFRSSSSTSLFVALDLDSRSIFYLTLLALFYCCILIRASAAASLNNLENKAATTAEAATAKEEKSLATKYNLSAEVKEADDVVAGPTVKSTVPSTTVAVFISNVSSTTVFTDVTFKPKIVNSQRPLFKRDAAAAAAASAAANQPDNDDDDSSYHDDEFDEYDALIKNKSAKGKYIGAPCTDDMKCEPTLIHVTCDKETQFCGCEKNYPVQLGLVKGCDKPKKLGEQCFYDETCQYNDENSFCVQVRHNAKCQCASGFHSVSYTKPTRRVFCTQDLSELNSDLPTLLGVSTGIAVLAGLICMVLHLFSKTKYPRHRNFGDANLPPPILYSSDTGIPLTVQSGRPSSRSSIRSSGSIGSYGNRRASTGASGGGGMGGATNAGGGSKGILVSTSRTGSRRPSLASVHSTSSSVRSYSMMRFEKETQQKEIRQEMKLRLARLQQQQQLNQNKPQIIIGDILHHHGGAMNRFSMLPTPSPITPNSTDELLPVDEAQEYAVKSDAAGGSNNENIIAAATFMSLKNFTTTPSTSAAAAIDEAAAAAAAAYIGPCSSSTEAL